MMEAIPLRNSLIAKDFIDGMRQCDIAIKYKISRTRVQQILKHRTIRTLLPESKKL
jgi:Mor family transcriptional regulator